MGPPIPASPLQGRSRGRRRPPLGWRGKKKILQKTDGERSCGRSGQAGGAPRPAREGGSPGVTPRQHLGRASEVQGREVPEVAVEELADALALLQAEVVVLALWRRQVDELVRQETREVLPALLQEGVHGGQRREAHLLHRALAGQRARPWQQCLCRDGKQP